MDKIELRKELNRLLKEAREASKPDWCIVCGKKQTSFCNSHSVPRMVLKNIARDGKILQPNITIGIKAVDDEKGINNSGTFNYICKECDKELFKNYENPEILSRKVVTDKLLAEIALKDTLLMLSKRNLEDSLFEIIDNKYRFEGLDDINLVNKLDKREYYERMQICLKIKENDSNNFHVLYDKLLPYVTPIASQTMIALNCDLKGVEINNKYDYSENNSIEYIHIAVFPLKKQTRVLFFYHRRNRKYKKFRNQFNCLVEKEKLGLINYLVLAYSENYYYSPLIKDGIENNEKLSKLTQEVDGKPNLGYVNIFDVIDYSPIMKEEVPNFLSEEYSLPD